MGPRPYTIEAETGICWWPALGLDGTTESMKKQKRISPVSNVALLAPSVQPCISRAEGRRISTVLSIAGGLCGSLGGCFRARVG